MNIKVKVKEKKKSCSILVIFILEKDRCIFNFKGAAKQVSNQQQAAGSIYHHHNYNQCKQLQKNREKKKVNIEWV